jgi:PAS domain S-box-containing protein
MRSLDGVLDLLPVLAYLVDLRDLTFSYVNNRSVELLGCDPEELREQGLAFFASNVHADDADRIAQAESRYSALPDGEIIDVECRFKHRDGRWRWIRRREVVFDRAADGGPELILGTAEDVTDRKSAERHLVRHHERMLHLLAYDIHDGFVQDVVGAQMALESIIEMISAGETDCLQELIMLRGLLRKAIGEGRRMITELRPMIIDEMGVVEAIRYLVGEEETADRLSIDFTHHVGFDRLAPMLEGTVFRIAQEALSNIKRHAGVEDATIRLSQNADQLLLEIEDRGSGFKPEEVGDQHCGLEGIRERARLFGGRALIRSAPGKGTLVSVTLPTELPPEWRDAHLGS